MAKAALVEYKDIDVLEAARQRVARVFDEFDNIVVSVSSGKDSTVLFHLAIEEAERRDRKVKVFFLDQEAEYAATVRLIDGMMRHPRVIPMWYQVPIYMTNATSHREYFLYAWGEGEEWMREKSDIAIHSLDVDYPRRFYKFFDWLETQFEEPTAMLVGIRSKESLNRFRAITRNPGYKGIWWSTKTKNPQAWRFYPIYDWCFPDIWKYIADHNLEYNPVYDQMFAKIGHNISDMRVSNLIHEKAFYCLANLQEFEPETYERLLRRLQGIHCAALYADDRQVYSADELPPHFGTWREYRDYLLDTTPTDKVERFRKRFAGQAENEAVHRHQCRQILLNDWENNVPVVSRGLSPEMVEKWSKIL